MCLFTAGRKAHYGEPPLRRTDDMFTASRAPNGPAGPTARSDTSKSGPLPLPGLGPGSCQAGCKSVVT